MKFKISILFFFFILFNIIPIKSTAQQCNKINICDFKIDDSFDYRGQSSFAFIYPGDTIQTKLVVYSNQYYNIFVCSEPQLGTIEFNIFKKHKKYITVIDSINSEDQIMYKKDEYGDLIYDDYGDLIKTGKETIIDTVYKKKKIIEKEIIFNNLNNKNGVASWVKRAKKTQVLIIEIIAPENASEGCLELFVGHKATRKSSFGR